MKAQLTREQKIEALKGSIEHHMDGCMRTEEDFREFCMSREACNLCGLYHTQQPFFDPLKCQPCILYNKIIAKPISHPCAIEYYQAFNAKKRGDFPVFHTNEVAIVRCMKRELEKLESKIIIPFIGTVKDGKVTLYGEGEDKVKKLKYKVGDKLWWDGKAPHLKNNEPQEVEVISFDTDFDYMVRNKDDWKCYVTESSLSPLDKSKQQGYQVGDEFVVTNVLGYAKVWNNMRCKIVRFGNDPDKYEMGLQSSGLLVSAEEFGKTTYTFELSYPIIRCIDPKFWTVKKDGVLIRLYEDSGRDIVARIIDTTGERYWHSVCYSHFPKAFNSLLLTGLKDIPVMPYGYMGVGCVYEYPEWDSK